MKDDTINIKISKQALKDTIRIMSGLLEAEVINKHISRDLANEYNAKTLNQIEDALENSKYYNG